MIGEIRSYFKSTIKEIDPDLKPHKRFFVSNDIDINKQDCTYFIGFGDFASSREDTTYNGEVPVTVEIWAHGKNDELDRLDAAYDSAIEILQLAQDQTRIDQASFVKSVVGSVVNPAPVENNDNSAKYTIQFTVSVSYQAC